MKTALLVIDVQNEYFNGLRKITYPADSFSNILKAMDAAHAHALPIVLIQHASPNPKAPAFRLNSHGWELHSEVASRPHDVVLGKQVPGSFTNTPLEDWLRSRDIEKVVICGYMTQMCCDTTARQAFHRGYKVDFLSDATGTLNQSNPAGAITAEELHKTILIVQQSMFSLVISTKDWISELNKQTRNQSSL